MSLKSPLTLVAFPRELHLNVLTFLRATDLSALQQTSRCFNNRDLIAEVVDHCAHVVVSVCGPLFEELCLQFISMADLSGLNTVALIILLFFAVSE